MKPPEELIAALAGAANLLVVGHINPDVDAIGSMLALSRAVPAGNAYIALPAGRLSQKVRFMLQIDGRHRVATEKQVAEADLVAVVDTAGTNRVNVVGEWEAIADKFIVNIDHHITNSDFGRINWVIDDASSTCEVVYHLLHHAGWGIDPASASLLYAGIYADTAGFSLPSASSATFETAADLVRMGADIERVGSYLCRSQQRHEFELLRLVYHNTRLAADNRIAYSTLTHEEITLSGSTPEDIDDQVSIPRSLSGIRIAMLLSEAEPDVVRINLRGEEGMPVLELARRLGGGGHTHSAGVRMRGALAWVVDRVLREAELYLQEVDQ